MSQNRFYSSTAAKAALQGPITNVATSMVVNTTTGWPVSFPFTLILERDTANEEAVAVTSAPTGSAPNITVPITRGVDNTAQISHSAGASVEHGVTARDFNEPQVHIAASTAVHGISGAVVGTTDTQTLSGKTLTSPTINTPTSTGGTVQTASSGQRTALEVANVDRITFYSGSGAETVAGYAGSTNASPPYVSLVSPSEGFGGPALSLQAATATGQGVATLNGAKNINLTTSGVAGNAVTITGNLHTTQVSTLDGVVNAGSDVNATGNMTAVGNMSAVNVTGSGTVQGASVTATGTMTCSTGHVTGSATIDTNLTVTGSALLGSASVTGTMNAVGDVQFNGTSLPRGKVAAASVITASTTINAGVTALEVTGLAYACTLVTGRKYEFVLAGQAASSVANDIAVVEVRDGSTTVLQGIPVALPSTSFGFSANMTFVLDAVASSAVAGTSILSGARTLRIFIHRGSGTGNINMAASSTSPGQLYVKDIGAAG